MNIKACLMRDSSDVAPAVVSPRMATLPKRSVGGVGRKVLQAVTWMSTTRANSRAGLVTDVAASCLLLYAGVRHSDIHPLAALLTLFFGVAVFSFVEYGFHRWLFHGSVGILEQGHHKHHQQPLGHDSLPFFLPPLALLAIVGLLAMVAPMTFALLLTAGLAAGYAIYGLSHAVIHNIRFRHSLPRSWAAAHHIHHCHPGSNFGVTTPFWDMVFGTKYMSEGKGPTRGMVAGTPDEF